MSKTSAASSHRDPIRNAASSQSNGLLASRSRPRYCIKAKASSRLLLLSGMRLHFLVSAIFALCNALLGLSLPGTRALPFSSWTDIPPSGPSPGYVTGHAGVADHGSDAALFFGGHNSYTSATNDLWRFSFHGKLWEKLNANSPPPPPRHGHCGATCSPGSQSEALFFGGTSASGSLMNDVWVLSFGANTSWRQLSSSTVIAPSPRKDCSCACLNASLLVVFGGYGVDGASDELWVMDINTKAWNLLPSTFPAPGPIHASCMHALSAARAFLFGGINSNNVALRDAWVLNINMTADDSYVPSVRWELMNAQPGPAARGFHGCVGPPVTAEQGTSNVVHVHGGVGGGETRNDNILQDFWSCSLVSKGELSDFQCRTLTFASALPLCSQCISVMVSNMLLVHGGLGIGAQVSGITALIFMSDMRVEVVSHPGPEAPSARSGAAIRHFTHINNAKYIFLHGGADSKSELLHDTWLFDLASRRYVLIHIATASDIISQLCF